MVDFMLHAMGEQPFRRELGFLAVIVEIFDAHFRRTFDIGQLLGDGEAAFDAVDHFA